MFLFAALALLLPNSLPAKDINTSLAIDNLSPIPTFSLDQFSELEMSNENKQLIYFIRHGESEFNKPHPTGIKITSGKSLNAKLTDLGEKQAIELAEKISQKIDTDEKFIILSSTALRAQETARLFFEKLAESHCQAELGASYEGLCELGLGDWEGKPKDNAYEQAIEPWEKLSQIKKFNTDKVEGGESFKTVAQRALRDLDKLSKDYPGRTIFVVSHFHTMNAIALELSGHVHFLSDDESTNLPFIIFDNCDVLEIEVPIEDGIEKAAVKMHIQAEV